jgi:hypothetical protein
MKCSLGAGQTSECPCRGLDERACLAYLYLPESKEKSDSDRIAEELKLSDAEPELRALLARRAPVTRGLLERIASANDIEVEALLSFEGGYVFEPSTPVPSVAD